MRLGQLLEQMGLEECTSGRQWLGNVSARDTALFGLCFGRGFAVTVEDDDGVAYVFSALPAVEAEQPLPAAA